MVNRCLKAYLRCICSSKPKEWSKLIPLAKWWHNTVFYSAIELTPYEVVYNQPPPVHLPHIPRETRVEAIDRPMQRREDII